MIEDIRRALYESHRNIMHRAPFTSDEARAMLRIEITDDAYVAFRADLRHLPMFHNPDHMGPDEFEGVALYHVRRLPEPGWRVINPMKAGR